MRRLVLAFCLWCASALPAAAQTPLILAWDPLPDSGVVYEVLKDGAVIGNSTTTSFTLPPPDAAVHVYAVRGYVIDPATMMHLTGGDTKVVYQQCNDSQYTAQYFANTALTGYAFATDCPLSIDFSWPDGSGPYGHTDDFSIRFKRQASYLAGTLTANVTADDGVRVSVNGNTIVNAWMDQGATAYQGVAHLADGPVTLGVEYYEHGGDAILKLAFLFTTDPLPPQDPCVVTPLKISGLRWPSGQSGTKSGTWNSGTFTLTQAAFKWNPQRFEAIDSRNCALTVTR